MSKTISYKELVQAIDATEPETIGSRPFKPIPLYDGRKARYVRSKSPIPLAGILQEHNGVMGSGAGAIKKEIFIGYAQPGDHTIQLMDGELYICLDRDGESLFRIASTAIFDELLDDYRTK